MLDEVEFVLADARERAQRIIDESMDRARELIAQERVAAAPVTGIDPRAFDDLRRGLRGLVTEVRDIQQRLSRIEALLREQNQRDARRDAAASQSPSTGTAYAAPSYSEPEYRETQPAPRYEEPRYEEPQYEEPQYEKPEYGEAQYEAPEYEAAQYEDPNYEAAEAAAVEYGEPEYTDSSDEATYPASFDAPDLEERVSEPPMPEPSAAWGAPVPPSSPAYEPEIADEDDDDTDQSTAEAAPAAGYEPSAAATSEFEDEHPAAPFAPAPAPPRSTFSVVPPQRREWLSEPDEDARAGAPEPPAAEDAQPSDDDDAAPPAYAPAAFEPAGIAAEAETQAPEPEWDDDEYDAPAVPASGLSGSPLVTFLPSDGAITLRVAPVAGFQGLMRIQDALTRLPVVRHASVEAYSQGEARLRIELADTSDSDEIAEGLARALRGPARVEDASEVNRELLIALR